MIEAVTDTHFPQSNLFLAKVFAAYFAVLGLICGLAYSLVGAVYDITYGGANAGTALAFLALIGMPLIATILGFFLGLGLALPVRIILQRFA